MELTTEVHVFEEFTNLTNIENDDTNQTDSNNIEDEKSTEEETNINKTVEVISETRP